MLSVQQIYYDTYMWVAQQNPDARSAKLCGRSMRAPGKGRPATISVEEYITST